MAIDQALASNWPGLIDMWSSRHKPNYLQNLVKRKRDVNYEICLVKTYCRLNDFPEHVS